MGRRGDQAGKATLADEKKVARFAAKSKGGGDDASRVAAAKASLNDTLTWFESYLAANRSSTVGGFARMDAVGRILNQIIRFTSDPKNSLEPNAPANFPTLWDAPRHDYVQWTAVAGNAGAGSIGRNAGEVAGTFGQIQVKHYETKEEAKKGYPSSIQGMALVRMEETEKQGNHRKATSTDATADLMSYKARPLNGVWATAPYLHNGSVPSLYDLLLPPASRPKKFTLGRREYDPRKVGYVSEGDVPFVVDTSLTGNGNGGHEYGVTLSDADRWALVEYLKTL